MYIVFFVLTVVFYAATAILDARNTKKYTAKPVTEKERLQTYKSAIIQNYGSVLAVLVLCLIVGIPLGNIGLRGLEFIYPTWFTIAELVFCGGLFLLTLYQMINYLTSAKYREAIKEKMFNGTDDKNDDKAVLDLIVPRNKKEKKIFFWTALGAGIGEEIVSRGFLFFLLSAIFPSMSVVFIVVIGGVIFGLWHFYQGVQGIIKTALWGMVFGCLFIATGSLLPGILLHFVADFSSAFLISEEA